MDGASKKVENYNNKLEIVHRDVQNVVFKMRSQPISLFVVSPGERLTVSVDTSKVHVELLRGRDGLPGRDGSPGPYGYPGPRGPPGYSPSQGGATYTRWGKTSCPNIHDTEHVYTGIASGTYYNHNGGGVNYLCLPNDPEYPLGYTRGRGSDVGLLYGAQYAYPLVDGANHRHVPCAVCHVPTRAAVIMIPAKAACPATWYIEYYGYLMSEEKNHKRSTFVCVDKDMESLPGRSTTHNAALFQHVEAVCEVGLPCPPYNNYKELNCVVCTK